VSNKKIILHHIATPAQIGLRPPIVVSNAECPNCKYSNAVNRIEASGFRDLACPRCGFARLSRRDPDKIAFVRSYHGDTCYELSASGDLVSVTTDWYSYGSWCYVVGETHCFGGYSKPVTQRDIDVFVSEVTSDEDYNTAESYLVIWHDERQEVEVVFGQPYWLTEDDGEERNSDGECS